MTLISETTNISPESAIARRQQSKQQIIEILAGVKMPYCIGVGKQIKAAHPAIPVKHISFALRCITRDKRYLQLLIDADHRHSLDGTVTPLLQKHKDFAASQLKKKPAKHKPATRTAVEKPATQQKPAQRACIITTKRRRTLTLKSGIKL